MKDTIGIDVSKDTLDAHRQSSGKHSQFTNDAAGLRSLIRWIGTEAVRVVYEATGRYHRDLEGHLGGLCCTNRLSARVSLSPDRLIL